MRHNSSVHRTPWTENVRAVFYFFIYLLVLGFDLTLVLDLAEAFGFVVLEAFGFAILDDFIFDNALGLIIFLGLAITFFLITGVGLGFLTVSAFVEVDRPDFFTR